MKNTIISMLNDLYNTARELSGEDNPELMINILLSNGETITSDYYNTKCEDGYIKTTHPDTWQISVIPYANITALTTA